MITDVSSVTILTVFLGRGVKIYYLDYLILLFYLMLLFMRLSSSQGFPSGGTAGISPNHFTSLNLVYGN